MYDLLIKAMVCAALVQLGFKAGDLTRFPSFKVMNRIERASRSILFIDWKPISVFPEEAKRFR
jgi:hypothetical protein